LGIASGDPNGSTNSWMGYFSIGWPTPRIVGWDIFKWDDTHDNKRSFDVSLI